MKRRTHRQPRLNRCPPSQWIGIRRNWRQFSSDPAQALVSLPAESLRLHAYVIGASGSGKTVFIHHLLAQYMRRGQSVVVLDARGDLALATIELVARAGVDPAKIAFFNLREKERPLGFNPLAGAGEPYFRALNVLDAIAAQNDLGVQTAEYLRFALLLLSEAGGTLTMLEALFYDADVRRALMAKAQSDNVRAFWLRYEEAPEAKRTPIASAVCNKISILSATEPLQRMFGHQQPANLARQLATPGSVTVVSLAVDEVHSAGWMAGSMFLSAICREIFSRVELAESERNPVALVVDEFENFGMRDFESILAEGRRFKFTAIMAHQTLAQLTPKMRAVVLGNVGVKLVFRTARQDADLLNRDLTGDSKAFDLPNLGVGEAVLWRRGQSPIEIAINTPLVKNVGELSPACRELLKRLRELTPPFETKPKTAEPASEPGQHEDHADLEDWL